uniref:BHLH domain-containing protein n=1 Tax=Monopterus albus TaxID=43700 RepID=A0A3Q3IDZ2_MONAL
MADRESQFQDSSDSDSEPEGEPVRVASTGPFPASFACTQVIHSGHFMVSSPHSDSTSRRRKSGTSLRYDFDTVNRMWCQTYRYGPFSSGSLSIDPTLTRLFECMSLAYSGKIVSPKWKSFKGLRLLWRDKIRLNNVIWRAWFIQYVEKKKKPVCGFVTPLEGSEADMHRKPEAIVLEGSYWKQRIEVVIKEYHKWRIYYKKRLQKKKDDILSMLQEGQICQAKLEKWSSQMYQEPEPAPVEAHMFDLDCLLSDISDTLFTMTQKPCPWASDRHNIYTSNADVIQPGLTPLQPNLDDFMDNSGIFMNHQGQSAGQAGFAECGYFESSCSTAFAPAPSPVVTTPQLLIDSPLAQPSPCDNLPQPTSSSTQSGQDCSQYHTSSITSVTMPYEHQSYPEPPVSVVFTTSIKQPASVSVPFLYPLPCHKFGYYTTTSTTSSVITHTASSMEAQGSVHQAHSYPPTADTYPQSPCHPLSYLATVSDPVQAVLPCVTMAHCFSVPEQVTVTGAKGKHRQKTGGVRTVGPTVTSVGPVSASPASTSCLAKLLSSSTRERKPSLGFDTTLVTTKGQGSSSPSSSSSSSAHVGGASSQLQHEAGWPAGIPVLTPLHSQSARTSTSRGSATSALLSRGSKHGSTSATLLIPKTEKLSPLQLYSTDRSTLTGHPHQTSPQHPLDKASNPESLHSGFSGHGKIESSKQTQTKRIIHISAEQKRRFNIKLGFDTLHNLVTTLSSQPSIKISKATTLQKTAEYISKMQQERAQLHEEAQKLREEIQLLNSAINACQQQLPATGVPITRQRFDHMRQKFREYVQAQTLQNWKFWIFSIIIEPLFESYNGMVSTASVEDLCRSTLSWLERYCSLPALRPTVLSSLRLLSTTTAILTDPSLLPGQATLAVTQGDLTAALDHSLQPTTQDTIHPM